VVDDLSVEEGSGSGLVIHAVVFVAVNLLLIAVWALTVAGASFEAVPDLLAHPSRARDASFFPIYVIVGWGTALLIHAGVFVAGIPRRRRLRRARRRQRRRLQRTVVGALGDTVLADAAIAGIKLVDGEKEAKRVKRDASRQRAKKGRPPKASSAPRVKKAKAPPRATSERRDKNDTASPSTADPVANDGDTAETGEPMFGRRLADRSATRHWVAVMFTDIVDSTPLNQHFGDDAWAELLAAHRSTVRGCVASHAGREVGTQGDGFLVRFEAPDDAAACAIALQRHLQAERSNDDRRIHIRIGIHAGEVVQNDDDLVGRVINLASRVTGAAAPDEILVTEPFADHLTGGHPLVDRGLKALKGFDQPRHLLALAWNDADEIVLDDSRD
jgi:class 3 adenylate cyclase